ncbi:MAG: CPBP family intramembrane metalloprotease [Acidobacteria bacterium]|nr:CPBP family intramembrane metalloprotease [Acidobacteriota bacterium]
MLRAALKIVVYVFLYLAAVSLIGPLATWAGGYLAGVTAGGFAAALFANWMAMRIYEGRPLSGIGLGWRRASAANLGLGLAAGAVAACLVLAPPLAVGAARLSQTPPGDFELAASLFLPVILFLGSAGEEIAFRGFGFQVLLGGIGPWATVLPVGILFAALHAANPNATWLGLANTAGFGILFGYAFLRSRDLWLPIGLHYGWNLTLPLFGVNVSGITMKVTGYTMEWTAGELWSGGAYGPEASVLTSAIFPALFLFLWRAPVCRQSAPLLGPRET